MTIEEHICVPDNRNNAKMSVRSLLTSFIKFPGLPSRKSFALQNVLGYPIQEDKDAAIRETAWLDGLRGLAAFLVMIYHYNLAIFFPPSVEAPWGSTDLYQFEESGGKVSLYTALWRLPIVRLPMTAGHAQVSIFFVLSGFVLSWGPLGSIRTGQKEKFVQGLGSAVFRRWLRLYLPCFAISLWQCLEVYFGLRVVGGKEQKSNLFAQIWDWVVDSEKFANPFMIDRDRYSSLHDYDWTMWTIPYEFAGSLMIFGTFLAIGRFRQHSKRTLVMFLLTAYACLRAEWTYWLFANGMLLASYVRANGGFASLTEKTTVRSRIAWIALIVFSLLLAGIPEKSQYYDRPGYEWLTHIIPPNYREIEGGGRWLWNWAGIIFIFSACHLSSVRRIFEFSFMRYLGRISYMLYLTHRITLNLLGEWLKKILLRTFGLHYFIDRYEDFSDPNPFLTAGLWLTLMVVLIPLELVVAHWAEVLIDGPSTRLARRVDDWFSKQGEEAQQQHMGNGSYLPSSHTRGAESVDIRTVEMQTAPNRESISREEGAALMHEQVHEMTELDPRPLPDR